MKKLSILLMVLVMAGGFAFAADFAFSGDATFSTSFDLDALAGGFDAVGDATEVDLALELIAGASAESAGSGDLYAVLGVSADALVLDETGTITGGNTLSLDTFKVVAGDLTVNLLGGTNSADYASYGDYNDDDAADVASTAAVGLTDNNGGVGLAYAGMADLDLGLDFWFDNSAAPKTTYFVFAGYSSEVAEGIDLSVAGGYDANGFDASAKVDYASDDYSLAVAFDSQNNFAAYDAAVKVNAVVDIVTMAFDAYWDGGASLDNVYINNQNDIALDDITLGLDFFWNDVNSYAGSAIVASASIPVDTITLAVDGSVDLDDYSIGAGVKATVALDDATSAWVDVNTLDTFGSLDIEIGASSTSIIDNATTKLVYDSGDLLAAAPVLGTVKASLTVSL